MSEWAGAVLSHTELVLVCFRVEGGAASAAAGVAGEYGTEKGQSCCVHGCRLLLLATYT